MARVAFVKVARCTFTSVTAVDIHTGLPSDYTGVLQLNLAYKSGLFFRFIRCVFHVLRILFDVNVIFIIYQSPLHSVKMKERTEQKHV